MTEQPTDLVRVLASGGDRAMGVAEAISLLVKNGAALGELEEYQVADPDAPDGTRTCKRMPLLWLERLGRAATRGAFERMPVKKIVDRILAPLPDGES